MFYGGLAHDVKANIRTGGGQPWGFDLGGAWKIPINKIVDASHSDILRFFGASGDLAYKKIFPALQAMVKRGNLNIPIIGVAKAGWNLEQLRKRAKDSLEKHGGIDPLAFEKRE